MQSKIDLVERVFHFQFKGGFEDKWKSLGSPQEDLEFWFKNAQIFESISLPNLSLEDSQNLITLLECFRIETTAARDTGFNLPFQIDLSCYQFINSFLNNYADRALTEVLKQEKIEAKAERSGATISISCIKFSNRRVMRLHT